MNTGTKIWFSIMAAMVITMAVSVASIMSHPATLPTSHVAGSTDFSYYGSGTNTAILCPRGISTLLSTSTPARTYIRITNITPNTTMYIGLGTSAATGTGITLTATSSPNELEIGGSSLSYAGPIYCNVDMSSGSSATATITTLP